MRTNNSGNKKNIHDMHYGAESFSYKNAEKLRENQTQAEALLWEELKNKKLDGLKFRRQHPVSRFVVDFYCHTLKLVIELDGGVHKSKEVRENDGNRQHELEEFGLKVLRFNNEEVLSDIVNVLSRIRDAINPK
jgi:imidazole glycerol-phosphate synthase subunit HisF